MELETGRITLDDVRAALGDVDPRQTNASKVRDTLGRGSFATIQRHLETIRAELVQPVATVSHAVPSPPTETLQALWHAAYSAAQVSTLARLDAVTAERDGLHAQVSTITTDRDAAVQALDSTIDALETAQAALRDTCAALADERDAAIEARDAAIRKQGDLCAAIDAERAKNASQADLAARDAEIARQAMQATLDNLVAQVSQRDALLATLAQQRQVV